MARKGLVADQTLTDLLLQEVRRRLFVESVPRLLHCLSLLNEDDLWWRPNPHSNSVGNLLVHLCGNVQQWVVAGLGRAPDTRQRNAEFAMQSGLSKAEVQARLAHLQEDVLDVLGRLQPEDLQATYQVQSFQETGVAMLVHVVEHFSYHTGQVVYLVKQLKDLDTGFYQGVNLDQTN